MQVHITGRQVEISDGIRDHVYSKLERTLVDVPRIEDVRVVIAHEKLQYAVEVLVQGKHIHIEGKSASENMFTAIDEAVDKAEKQLRRLRQKIQDAHHHPGH